MITKEIIALSVCSVIPDVTVEDIMKDRTVPGAKEDKTRFARQLCMALARKHGLGSSTEVGKYYGGRDHATCLHSQKIINREIELYSEKAMIYHRIEIVILEMSIKSIKQQFQQQMDIELAKFIRRANEISSRLMQDIELKESEIAKLTNKK